jgi:hypothetical protein
MRIFPALGVAALPVTNLAKLNEAGITPATLVEPESDPQYQGVQVVAIGNPRYRYLGQYPTLVNYAGGGQIGMYQAASTVLGDDAIAGVASATKLLFIDGSTITHGYSGGPVFQGETDGTLIGLVQGGDPSVGTRSWAVPTQLVTQAIRDGAGVSVSAPFTTKTQWPDDGFRSALYSRENDSNQLLEAFPQPLVVHRAKPFAIQVRTILASVTPRHLPGLTIIGSSEERTDTETGLTTITWRFSLSPTFAARTIQIPFAVKLAGSGDALDDLIVDGAVDCQTQTIAIGVEWDWLALNHRTTAQRGRLRLFDGAYTFLGNCVACLAARGGFAIPVLYAARNTFAPIGNEVLEHRAVAPLLGMHVEGLFEGRFFDLAPVSPRLAAGIAYETYFYEMPDSALETGKRATVTLPIELSLALRFAVTIVLRARLTYEALPTLDTRYPSPAEVSFPQLKSVDQPKHWLFGFSAEQEFGL